MKIIQSPLFARKVKKFHKAQKIVLDNQIRKILMDPNIGEEKKGDLKGIFVYKFKMKGTQYLLSYRIQKDILKLITVGSHENYYRDLKTYLQT